MKIRIAKEDLMSAVNTTMKAVPNKTTMQILECILITAENDEVRFTANSTEIGIETFVTAQADEEGSVAVEAKTLAPIVSKLPDGEVTLETEGDVLNIKCKRAKFKLSCRSGEDFPSIEIVSRDNAITMDQETLKDVIRQTVFSTSTNDTNKMMCGELFEVNGDTLKVTALDGHRVAIRTVNLDRLYGTYKAIIPSKTLRELIKLLTEGDVDVYFTDSWIAFSFENTLITSRLIEGDFYDISKMMKDDFNTKIEINRQALNDCMERAMLLVKEIDRKPVVFTIEDTLKAEIKSQLGTMDEEIEIDKEGEDITIGINPRFLTDVLRSLYEERITVEFTSAKFPCYIRGEDYIYIILPIQVRESV